VSSNSRSNGNDPRVAPLCRRPLSPRPYNAAAPKGPDF
jgi:hypothetical protein